MSSFDGNFPNGVLLQADTTLLLLADGSPICSNCSYSCNICKKPILDEAIMTGEDSYHAACFTCRTCHKRIEELVFAKTSQGIYCMDCHNERVARSRRRAERKRTGGSRRPREAKSRDREACSVGLFACRCCLKISYGVFFGCFCSTPTKL